MERVRRAGLGIDFEGIIEPETESLLP